MTDDEFIAGFENCTFPNESFHHADHVHMAFLYLCRYPALEALQRFTWAFLFLIRERMVRGGCEQNWLQFAAGNADLLEWKDNVLKKYYREETLKSDLAKRTFLFPDKTSACPK